jgi:predicted nucleotidyltransferase
MNKIIEGKKRAISKLCKKYDVKSLYLFGSVSTGKFKKSSDIDVLVSFKDISVERYTDNYFELHYRLEELFERKIDLVTVNSLANPFFIKSIEETKILLYAA